MQKTLGNQPFSGDNGGTSEEAGRVDVEASHAALTTDAGEGIDMADPHSKGKAPAFQFYPKDFLTDSNVVVMSLHERGAYITLICQCWIEGSIPSDIARLARLCGVPIAAFRKLWPAILPCFRAKGDDRYIHPRLEMERKKQAMWRAEQSERGRQGAQKRWRKHGAAMPTPSKPNGAAIDSPMAEAMPKHASSSSVFDLQSSSSDSRQKAAPPSIADARSKRPIFKGTQFVVFEWMLDDLRRMLGRHFEDFDVHAWFFDLDAKARDAGLVVPQRDGGQWLQTETLAEAVRRGLPVAATAGVGKTAGNQAAAARFVARGAQ